MLEHHHLSRLRTLKLYGMVEAWSELQAELPRQPLSAEALLLRLLDAEQADRQIRSLSYQLRPHVSRITVTSPGSTGRKRHCKRRASGNWSAAATSTAAIT